MTRNHGSEERGGAGNSLKAGAGVVSRRELALRLALATGTLILPGWAEALGAEEPPKAKVVVVTTKAVINTENPAPQALIDSMVEKGVITLAGKSHPIQAWTTFVRPTDTVCLPTAGGQLDGRRQRQ